MSSFANPRSDTTVPPVSVRCHPTRSRSIAQLSATRRTARPAGICGSRQRLGCLALTVTSVLGACAAPATEKSRVNWLGQAEHRIVVTAEAFTDDEPVRVGFIHPWQTEEYAFFETGGRQLELVFAEASKAFTVALNYQMPITAMVPTWNANARHDLAWGPLGRFDWRPGTWFYRIYQAGKLRRPCVGLLIKWDHIGEDPHNRPRRVLFGYACGVAGEALEDEEVRALIRGIAIRPRDGRAGWRFSAQRPSGGPQVPPLLDAGAQGPPAIATARGQGAFTESGNPGFPFAFARYYSEGGSGRIP